MLTVCFLSLISPVYAKSLKKATFLENKCTYKNSFITLKWKKVKHATSYEVYRSKTIDGKYKKIASTKKTSLKKKTQKDYFYKVRAVKKKSKGAFSEPFHPIIASGVITNMFFSYEDLYKIT